MNIDSIKFLHNLKQHLQVFRLFYSTLFYVNVFLILTFVFHILKISFFLLSNLIRNTSATEPCMIFSNLKAPLIKFKNVY